MKEQQALNIKFVEYTKKAGGKVKKRHQGIRLFFFRYILSIFMQDSLKANSSHNFFIYWPLLVIWRYKYNVASEFLKILKKVLETIVNILPVSVVIVFLIEIVGPVNETIVHFVQHFPFLLSSDIQTLRYKKSRDLSMHCGFMYFKDQNNMTS